MQAISIPHTQLQVARIGLGCMNMGGGWNHDPINDELIDCAEKIVTTALDCGINLFDHADIYVFGKSESVFGEVLKRNPGLREQMVLQTKCGIRFADPELPLDVKRYDFSKEHILNSVDESLRRLQTEYIDILLLHRPDALVEPEEVAKAFDELWSSGRVKYFGVSNHSASRMSLLAKHVRQPLIVNQMQFSLAHHQMIDEESMTNNSDAKDFGYSGALDYCHENEILMQAWSPLAQGTPLSEEGALRDCILQLSEAKSVSGEAVLLAWLLRHPADIQPIVGTTNPDRLKRCCEADGVELSREEWYALYVAARGELP